MIEVYIAWAKGTYNREHRTLDALLFMAFTERSSSSIDQTLVFHQLVVVFLYNRTESAQTMSQDNNERQASVSRNPSATATGKRVNLQPASTLYGRE